MSLASTIALMDQALQARSTQVAVNPLEIKELLEELKQLRELDVRKIMLDVVPGDGSGHEVYATSIADVEQKLSRIALALEEAEGHLSGHRLRWCSGVKAVHNVHSGEIKYGAHRGLEYDGTGHWVPVRIIVDRGE